MDVLVVYHTNVCVFAGTTSSHPKLTSLVFGMSFSLACEEEEEEEERSDGSHCHRFAPDLNHHQQQHLCIVFVSVAVLLCDLVQLQLTVL